MICVKLAKSFEAASEIAAEKKEWVAIETEYGDSVLDEGHPNVALALNHHGNKQDALPPSLFYKNFADQRFDNFIISHLDLDVVFGLLWSGGWLKKTKTTVALSDLVATADIIGFHRMSDVLKKYPEHIQDKYLAIGYLLNKWIINDDGQLSKDISKEVQKLLLKVKDIIMNEITGEQKQEVKDWFYQQQSSALAHLIRIKDYGELVVFVYRAPFSLTTAYHLNEVQADMIIQYNEQSRSLTLSCYSDEIAEQYFGKNGVIEPLQQFFGENAGGKKAIGGSPRDINLQPETLEAFEKFLEREWFNPPEIKNVG